MKVAKNEGRKAKNDGKKAKNEGKKAKKQMVFRFRFQGSFFEAIRGKKKLQP